MIIKYDRTNYLELFHSDANQERIFNRIRYLIILKIFRAISLIKMQKIKINRDDDVPLEKT